MGIYLKGSGVADQLLRLLVQPGTYCTLCSTGTVVVPTQYRGTVPGTGMGCTGMIPWYIQCRVLGRTSTGVPGTGEFYVPATEERRPTCTWYLVPGTVRESALVRGVVMTTSWFSI